MDAFIGAGLDGLDRTSVLIEVEVVAGKRGCHVLEHMAVAVAVSHVCTDILDNFVAAVASDMVIDPSHQNFLVAQPVHDVFRLVLPAEHDDFGVLFEGNFIGDVYLRVGGCTLMICQMSPRMMCSLFSMMSEGVMLMTVHPMDLADSIERFRFSILW